MISAGFQAQAGSKDSISPSSPRIYVKPPPHILADDTHVLYPLTLEQITTDFLPTLPASATDVQLMFYWSQVCPTDLASCNFSIVDAALKFWAEHQKRVILGFSTVSYPTRTVQNGTETFVRSTPDWVMRGVRTYSHRTKIIGEPHGARGGNAEMDFPFPIMWDPRFIQSVQSFIDMVAARYDGNPTISNLNMTFGLNGEDLTFHDMPDLSTSNWVAFYERPLVGYYLKSFKKTPLEFDMAFLGFLYLKAGRSGSDGDRQVIGSFVQYLVDHHILLSMEGLSSNTLDFLHGDASSPGAQHLRFLLGAQKQGAQISIEADQPFSGPKMQNLPQIEAAVREIRPNRIGFFNPSVTGGITHQLLHDLGYE